MHKVEWNIKLYWTKQKRKLMYEGSFDSITKVHAAGFKISKYFFYDFVRKLDNNQFKVNGKKSKTLEKYKNMIITKTIYNSDGTIKNVRILNI